ADAAYFDAYIIARDIQNNPDQLVGLFSDNPLNVSPISWSIKRGNHDLLVFLNTVLEYMETNGTWKQYEAPYKDELGGYFHMKRTYEAAGGPATQAQIQ